jgi:hypothetical protein
LLPFVLFFMDCEFLMVRKRVVGDEGGE